MNRIGVVIIGRNEGERLRACLASVLAMSYPGDLLDMIYVDSSSTDGSVVVAQSMGVRTVLLEGPTTAARGRNAGWAATDAPFILFLDGDTLLHPEFVATALPYLADPSIAGVYGNRREMRTTDSTYNAIFDMDWNAASSEGKSWSIFFGGDALVRRAALESVGGYNEALIAGEEPDMCRRLRGLGNRILHIDVPMTLPILLFLLIALALFARTAMKVRSRTDKIKLLTAYSIHSHLQQIPIFFGQLRYRRQRQRGGKAAIIEYKSIP
jgi:cellulose synthase/poly-beta-1,6-N-acetylglucosamine synthase-like glycosyltransferase